MNGTNRREFVSSAFSLAALTAAVSIFGLSTDLRGGALSLVFAGLWLLSAGLFWMASRQGSSVSS